MAESAQFIDLPGYEAPEENETIWRYMNFDRFVSMLSIESLWFSSKRQLVRSDPFEGIEYPNLTIEDALSNAISLGGDEASGVRQLRGMEILETGAITLEQAEDLRRGRNESMAINEAVISCSVAVNCWHRGRDESAAMWKISASSGADIAGRSTAGLLRSSLKPKDTQTVRIALVGYDDAPARARPAATFDSMLWKRRAYRYEQEVRALLWNTDAFVAEQRRQYEHLAMMKRSEPPQEFKALIPPEYPGETVDVELSELIEEIVVSPQIRSWQRKAVEAVFKAFGMEDVSIRPSTLTDPSNLSTRDVSTSTT